MEIFAYRLTALRQEKNISQQQLAEAIGVSASAIGFWETGTNEPKASYLLRLAKYFHVSSDYLLGLEDDLGVKQETSAPHPAIREEQVLMKHYRQLAPEDKAAVSRLLASLASRK